MIPTVSVLQTYFDLLGTIKYRKKTLVVSCALAIVGLIRDAKVK
jgi:hypothetical protein